MANESADQHSATDTATSTSSHSHSGNGKSKSLGKRLSTFLPKFTGKSYDLPPEVNEGAAEIQSMHKAASQLSKNARKYTNSLEVSLTAYDHIVESLQKLAGPRLPEMQTLSNDLKEHISVMATYKRNFITDCLARIDQFVQLFPTLETKIENFQKRLYEYEKQKKVFEQAPAMKAERKQKLQTEMKAATERYNALEQDIIAEVPKLREQLKSFIYGLLTAIADVEMMYNAKSEPCHRKLKDRVEILREGKTVQEMLSKEAEQVNEKHHLDSLVVDDTTKSPRPTPPQKPAPPKAIRAISEISESDTEDTDEATVKVEDPTGETNLENQDEAENSIAGTTLNITEEKNSNETTKEATKEAPKEAVVTVSAITPSEGPIINCEDSLNRPIAAVHSMGSMDSVNEAGTYTSSAEKLKARSVVSVKDTAKMTNTNSDAKHRIAMAIFAYKAEAEDELNLDAMDRISLLSEEEEEPEEGWLYGRVGDQKGWIPQNHVEVIIDQARGTEDVGNESD
eukprot:Clim_evm34s201 gene=Clim_evmTU34s201